MTDKRLAQGSIASTTLTDIYTFPSNSSGRIYSLVLTNTTSSSISVSVYINTYLLASVLIPSGSGKTKIVKEIIGAASSSDIVYLQAASSSAFNYLLTGSL